MSGSELVALVGVACPTIVAITMAFMHCRRCSVGKVEVSDGKK